MLLAFEIINDDEVLSSLGAYPASIFIVLARFICGIVLHMGLGGELQNGMKNMKLATNYDYRFENWRIAYLAGCMQASMVITVECVNFLAILTSFTVLDVVMNFMALAIIADFDNLFYGALGADPNKEVLTDPAYEEMFTQTRTTSKFARLEIEAHKLVDDTFQTADDQVKKSEYIYIAFKTRTFLNKLARMMYLALRLMYVSIWFYFLPFLTLLGSYFVPYFLI